MPTRQELLATGRNDAQIAQEIGADAVFYQDLDDLIDAVKKANPQNTHFETSCFDGQYITGDITPEYLAAVEAQRNDGEKNSQDSSESRQLDLNLSKVD